MKYLLHFLNPLNWIKAYRFKKANSKYDKSSYDLELYLYSKILKNDMLHYGYFEDTKIVPETISLQQLEDAQVLYAENIIQQIKDCTAPILDVGCGMGGLAKLMSDKELKVEVVTPNKNQIAHIKHKYSELKYYHTKFEKLESENTYGTIIHSESLQYINLDDAFQKVDKLIYSSGRWIITDYFRLHKDGINRSGHLLVDFKSKLAEYGWKIVYEQDITPNVLPTLSFINVYVDRFLYPVKHFAYEKLRYKNPLLFSMTADMQKSIDKKINKEMASIDVQKFIDEKKYMLFTLEKT
jgi:cyclopropane fatty-acyl-phospholipid synthase-like methyltransferase